MSIRTFGFLFTYRPDYIVVTTGVDKSMQKNFSERVANVHIKKSNKCNMCDYTSSHAGDLRTHLKMHSGEKSNKCNQSDYASSHAGTLKRHLKIHNGEKSNNQPALQCE